jgi:hypothetical protein
MTKIQIAMMIVNNISCIVTGFAILYMLTAVYNDPKVQKSKPSTRSHVVRLSLAAISVGSFAEAFFMEHFHISGVLMSMGICLYFSWKAVHYTKIKIK